jgi:hypothetical protein
MNRAFFDMMHRQGAYKTQLIYLGLREKWPQINERTTIEVVNSFTVYIDKPVARHISEDMIWVVIHGWRRLKRHFWSKSLDDLDNPAARGRWVSKLWEMVGLVPMYHLWRIWGRATRNEKMYRKGMEQTLNPVAKTYTVRDRDEVRLTEYGWKFESFRGQPEFFYLYAAYYPQTDTLYVRPE